MENKKVTKNDDILSFVRSGQTAQGPKYTLLPRISKTPTRLQRLGELTSGEWSLQQEKSLPDAINLLMTVEKQKALNIESNSRDVSYNLDHSPNRLQTEHEVQKNELYKLLGVRSKSTKALPTDKRPRRTRDSSVKRVAPIRESDRSPVLGVPSGRREVENLNKWLQSQMNDLKGEKEAHLDSIFERAQMIYTTCFEEAVRQVSVHCVERGQLIKSIWQAYLGLMEQALKSAKSQMKVQKDKLHARSAAIGQTYLRQIQAGKDENERMQQKLDQLRKVIDSKDSVIDRYKEVEDRLRYTYAILQQQLEKTRQEQLELKEENRVLKLNIVTDIRHITDTENDTPWAQSHISGLEESPIESRRINDDFIIRHFRTRTPDEARPVFEDMFKLIDKATDTGLTFEEVDSQTYLKYTGLDNMREESVRAIPVFRTNGRTRSSVLVTSDFGFNRQRLKNMGSSSRELLTIPEAKTFESIPEAQTFQGTPAPRRSGGLERNTKTIAPSLSRKSVFDITNIQPKPKEKSVDLSLVESSRPSVTAFETLEIPEDTQSVQPERSQSDDNLPDENRPKSTKNATLPSLTEASNIATSKLISKILNLSEILSSQNDVLGKQVKQLPATRTRQRLLQTNEDHKAVTEHALLDIQREVQKFEPPMASASLKIRIPSQDDHAISINEESISRKSTPSYRTILSSTPRNMPMTPDARINLPEVTVISLGEPPLVQKMPDRNHPALGIIQRYQNIPILKIKPGLVKKVLLKQISMYYSESLTLLKDPENGHKPMYELIYDYNMQKYGLAKVAENKFIQLLTSVLRFQKLNRVHTFGRFIHLYDSLNAEQLATYLECMEFVDKGCKIGWDVPRSDIDEQIMVPYVRAAEYLRAKFESTMEEKDFLEFRGRIEKLKEPDVTRLNSSGVIELDRLCQEIIDKDRIKQSIMRRFLKVIFDAADIIDSGNLQFEQIQLLVRHLSDVEISEQRLQAQFGRYADIKNMADRAMSFEAFASMSIGNELFTKEKLINFEKIPKSKTSISMIYRLQGHLGDAMSGILWGFNKSFNMYQTEIKVLRAKLSGEIDNPRVLWISYRLLQEESRKVAVEIEMEKLMPELCFSQVEEMMETLRQGRDRTPTFSTMKAN